MRIAYVHDWLVTLAGAEKVLEEMQRVISAPLYTLIASRKHLKGTFFEGADIHTSFLQKFPFASKLYRHYLPFFPAAIENLDLKDYDVVLSSSHAVAKGVLTNSQQLHICYCHTPMRYAWDLYHTYLSEAKLRGLKKIVACTILHYLRLWDATTTCRIDAFIANSHFIASRIKRVYGRESHVIYPPVDTDKFELATHKEDYYLTASRLVPYKKIDLIVEAFSEMPGKKLVVIGDGPDFEKIKRKAGKNIEILGYQSDEVLKNHLQRAQAFVFAAIEDFGILPVEAQACGTPVIAFNQGGVKETIIAGKTGVFFDEQTVRGVIRGVEAFEVSRDVFEPRALQRHAQSFSKERFRTEFENFVKTSAANFFL